MLTSCVNTASKNETLVSELAEMSKLQESDSSRYETTIKSHFLKASKDPLPYISIANPEDVIKARGEALFILSNSNSQAANNAIIANLTSSSENFEAITALSCSSLYSKTTNARQKSELRKMVSQKLLNGSPSPKFQYLKILLANDDELAEKAVVYILRNVSVSSELYQKCVLFCAKSNRAETRNAVRTVLSEQESKIEELNSLAR
jgi:hypothetical protein